MKKILFILPIFLLVFSCETDFTYNYFTIDDNMLRVIDFSYETSELAPGDMAVLIATFAGYTEGLTPETIEWRSSWNIITNPIGADVVVDNNLLQPASIEVVDSTDHTKTFRLSFKIPDSIMYQSEGVPEQWGDIFKYIDKSINPTKLGLPATKTEMLQLMEYVRDNKQLIDSGVITGEMLSAVSQLFTIIFRIEAIPMLDDPILASYNRKVYHSVRFNKWFEDVPGVYQNSAPRFDSVMVYALTPGTPVGSDLSFNKSAIVGTYPLVNDTVRVPHGSNNELLLVINPSERDVTMSLEQALISAKDKVVGNLGSEYYDFSTYDRTITGGFTLGDLLERENGLRTQYGYRLPATSGTDTLQASTYWFRIDDDDDDVPHRPRGSAIQEVTIIAE